MSFAEVPDPNLELIVADDGSIPAEQLARFGIRPGTHLHVVPTAMEETPKRRRLEGALVGKIDVEAFEEGLRWAREQRIAEIERDDT